MTFVLIDNSLGGSGSGSGGCHLFERPLQVVTACDPGDVAASLARLEEALAQGFHVAGYFSYELGYLLEQRLGALLPKTRAMPLLWFGIFDTGRRLSARAAGNWLAARAGGYDVSDLRADLGESAYLKTFAEAREMIAAGDIYQINLTFKSRFKLDGCPIALYRDLRAKQPTQYGAIIKTDEFTILSLSPELFLQRDGTIITTRPMKGTEPRRGNERDDEQARKLLAGDDKQRAENLMIVDLMRNDLGRISQIGSVAVEDLFAVETYPTLHQMTTSVRARLHNDPGLMELLQALFPPGSITGAPKIRAMQLIRKFEQSPRGVYTGAIGMISPDRSMSLNVAIRTAVVTADGRGEIGIGSGVVADSDGGTEYAECLLKSKFFSDPVRDFKLIETMLYDGELYDDSCGIWLLDEHMARLETSAGYFGFAFDGLAIAEKLEAFIAARQGQRLRVRLLLGVDGRLDLSAARQPATSPDHVVSYVVSPTRLNPQNIYLQHKTTRRQLFDDEFARYSGKGADEVIYCNDRDELSEGSRTTIFLERHGRLITPALSSGLLPGTLRAHLLAGGQAVEEVLSVDELARAETVYLGNSVRGLQRARLMK